MSKQDIDKTLDRWLINGKISLADYDQRQVALAEGREYDALAGSDRIEFT